MQKNNCILFFNYVIDIFSFEIIYQTLTTMQVKYRVLQKDFFNSIPIPKNNKNYLLQKIDNSYYLFFKTKFFN